VLHEREPALARQVVEPKVADMVTDLLVRVVEEGTGGRAKLAGFAVAGKTGTSQKIDTVRGGYHPKDRIASFVGFAPAHDPALAILVVVDTPTRESTYGGVVAAPVFQRIAEYALGKVGVYPQDDPVREWPLPTAEPELLLAAYSPLAAVPREFVTEVIGTPNFVGMAMRPALVRAQQRGWRVRVEGSGYVVSQDPAPGAPKSDDLLTLTFSMER
jgi:membrane peptidoglycan carboxypeptidase